MQQKWVVGQERYQTTRVEILILYRQFLLVKPGKSPERWLAGGCECQCVGVKDDLQKRSVQQYPPTSVNVHSAHVTVSQEY